MTGMADALARIDAIENRIVSLDPTGRASAAPSPADAPTGSGTAAASFAGVLEAAKTASAAVTGASATGGAAGEKTTSEASGAELVSTLQALFSANSGGTGVGSSAAAMQKLAGMIG